ncbi:hypothetical protein D9V84_03330 [Bacteroidetes/Chlorobi group bacterium Naka2016]|jgi:DnaJ-domain-containing protein 1|nr:MAG: hypothetical protein D9V84_03330 [Bacteroidetes/Chlorobi group bacterium Naka2016]
MGQIFNRIKRILKANLTDDSINFTDSVFLNEEEELKREIEEALRNSKTARNTTNKDFRNITLEEAYAILGLKSDATFEEVKIAYKKKVKEYHPDLVQNMGEELKELATQKIKEINYAFDLIKQAKGR